MDEQHRNQPPPIERTPQSIALAMSLDLDDEMFDGAMVAYAGDHVTLTFHDGELFKIAVTRETPAA